MREEVEAIIEAKQEEELMIIGDFNGHVGFLGEQKLDEGGKMIVEWMEEQGLILLNKDTQCTGLYT